MIALPYCNERKNRVECAECLLFTFVSYGAALSPGLFLFLEIKSYFIFKKVTSLIVSFVILNLKLLKVYFVSCLKWKHLIFTRRYAAVIPVLFGEPIKW